MNLDRIPKNSRIVSPISLPRYDHKGPKAVLLLHGYTGSPHDMLFLADYLSNEGFTVMLPRLPGHGTNMEDFEQSTWQQWLRASIDAYIHLSTDYEQPMICGLSMGGILAAIVASIFQPAKLVLAAPAFIASTSVLPWTPILKYVIPRKMRSADRLHHYPDNPLMAKLAKEYWSMDNLRKGADLYRLQRIGKKRLPKVRSETLTIVSKKDLTVPWSVSELVDAKIGAYKKKTMVLEESGHVVVNDCQRDEVANAISQWFSS